MKLVKGNHYNTIWGNRVYCGTCNDDYTCNICNKKHFQNKTAAKGIYQTFHIFIDDIDVNKCSQNDTIGSSCIKKYIKE
jgi:hypothetical protein